MAPIPVWSGNLRLSLVLVPVRMFPATSNEGAIAFRMIHEPSGQPIKYLKGVKTEDSFEEVPEEGSSRVMSTPRVTTSSLSPRNSTS